MFSTSITRTFKLTTPIVNAGMAMIARPALAAAVCEAGGLGTIGSDINPPDVVRDLVRQTKTLTKRPFGVDLIGDFVTDEHVSALIEEQVALAIFFWTLPTPGHVERLKQAGIKVWMQIGRVAEAEQAAALGADALIVQGAEAGGHNRAEASTMTLFPRIRRRFPGLPLLAAGGIVDGATMAAALVLGADAVWCGSRFLAAQEAEAHDSYKERVLSADVGDTAILSIYGPEWPDRPHGRSSMTVHAWRWGGKPRPSGMRKARSLARRSSTARLSRCRATAPSCRRAISTATSIRLA